jgi:tryptophanyl-tRNA synthetase
MDGQKLEVSLTGDRPSGPLHLGHYVGSLQNRLILQKQYDSFVMIADMQALAANFEDPKRLVVHTREVCKDYLAVGLEPDKTTIFRQSRVTALCELVMYYMNLVSVARLERNPTTKEELQYKSFSDSITTGFLVHPVSQAADITAFKAKYVPVGEDQLPLIEITNEIVRKFNRIYKTDVLNETEAVVGKVQRLVGIDGKAKASKSLHNAIFLSDTPDVIREKVQSMYTDPNHIKVSDPGKVEGNVVFAYLEAFHQNAEELEGLKKHYRRGGLGDSVLKSLLNETLQNMLLPIREKRREITDATVLEILETGTARANKIANKTLEEVRAAIFVT